MNLVVSVLEFIWNTLSIQNHLVVFGYIPDCNVKNTFAAYVVVADLTSITIGLKLR